MRLRTDLKYESIFGTIINRLASFHNPLLGDPVPEEGVKKHEEKVDRLYENIFSSDDLYINIKESLKQGADIFGWEAKMITIILYLRLIHQVNNQGIDKTAREAIRCVEDSPEVAIVFGWMLE